MRIYLFSIYVLLLLVGCGGGGSVSDREEDRADVVELAMPEIPDSLLTAEERVAYLVRHFWDGMDFGNTAMSLDTAFMEQSFVNFVALLPSVSEAEATAGVGRLLDKADEHSQVGDFVREIAEHYLDDPNSPMRSEELYVLFLRHIAESERCDEAQRERVSHRLRQAAKNRRGSRCADFRIFDRRGVSTTLHEAIAADTTLVMFYDPDCSQCKELTGRLRESPSSSRFPILAVDIAGDRGLWDATKNGMPEDWRVAFALDPVDDEEIYVLPALPSFYLLAPDGTVLLKDISPSELI